MAAFDRFEVLGKVSAEQPGGPGEPRSALQRSSGTASAGSPILDSGRLLIAGMVGTTGRGEPERGDHFGRGAARFVAVGETVGSAYPGDDWQGVGAEAYAGANRRQSEHTALMAVLDHRVQTVIAREADQIRHHRDKLQEQSDYLADLGHTTSSIGHVPGVGGAMRAATELAAVKTALGNCSGELYQLSNEVGENAAQLHELVGEYSRLSAEEAPAPDGDGEASAPPPGEGSGSDSNDQSSSAPPAVGGSPMPTSVGAVGAPTTEAFSETDAPPVDPGEVMAGMTSAFGAVGGVIGSIVAPLAAALTGAAGAAAQGLSGLASAPADAAETEMPGGIDPDLERGGTEDDDEETDEPAVADSDAGGDAVPTEIVEEPRGSLSAGSEPPPPAAPPAATRPPR